MSFYQHEFTNRIEKHSMGHNSRGELFYTVVFVPNNVTQALPMDQYPRLRIEGELHEQPFEGAMQPAKGKWYLLLSQKFLKEHNLSLGDEVEVRFNIGDQDYVDVPAELEEALAINEKAAALWTNFTPGKKRGFATTVASAKQVATRQKRAQKMIGYILEGKNPGGR
ncbi:MAG: YdeI/OmpD-associated family protein [Chloroflexota bacterium]